ncbi:tRNA nucleotidyltransferase/poly(A) polymerase [Planctomycetes bacterium Pla163]|uniref:tRNA nucleotidyltransferase/poly(A) polymerase n=1 Tax=Rohdeia mirabilis TaxID=2528008 RepID=A0A518D0H9_9BACT|nr:tRNA nucleotidyltransferase/poly(A) polymerase [Planctomycetes bacterium Pla163]
MVQHPRLSDLSDSQVGASTRIAQRLRDAGHQAWLVGGCVRDLALGRRPKDLDIASDARPEEVEALFEHTVDVGREFGTIVVAEFEPSIEVTTFRADGEYRDGRHPEVVAYADTPQEDARRRDFTCNALFLDPLTGEVLDPCGGLEDLEQGRLRAIGDPVARFTEDSLRLLRLVRFACTHDLEPERATLDGARRTAPLLARVARERVLSELSGCFDKGAAARALELLVALDLVGPALGDGAVIDARTLAVARRLPQPCGAATGLALVSSGTRTDDVARASSARVVGQLKPSRELAKQVRGLLEGLEDLRSGASDAALVRRRAQLDQVRWLELARAFDRASVDFEDLAVDVARLERVLAAWPVDRPVPAPQLDAAWIVAAGVAPGPLLGRILEGLVDAQIEGRVTDRSGAEEFVRAQISRAD